MMKRSLLAILFLLLFLVIGQAQDTTENEPTPTQRLRDQQMQARKQREASMQDVSEWEGFKLAWALTSPVGKHRFHVKDTGSLLPAGTYVRLQVYRLYPAFSRVRSHGMGREFVSGRKHRLSGSDFEFDLRAGSSSKPWPPGHYRVEMKLDSLQKPALKSELGEAIKTLHVSHTVFLGTTDYSLESLNREIEFATATLDQLQEMSTESQGWYETLRETMKTGPGEGSTPATPGQKAQRKEWLLAQSQTLDQGFIQPLTAIYEEVSRAIKASFMVEEMHRLRLVILEMQMPLGVAQLQLMDALDAMQDEPQNTNVMDEAMAKAGIKGGSHAGGRPWPQPFEFDMKLIVAKGRYDLCRETLLHASVLLQDKVPSLVARCESLTQDPLENQKTFDDAMRDWEAIANATRVHWDRDQELYSEDSIKDVLTRMADCENRRSLSGRANQHLQEVIKRSQPTENSTIKQVEHWLQAISTLGESCREWSLDPSTFDTKVASQQMESIQAARHTMIEILDAPEFERSEEKPDEPIDYKFE